MSIFRIYIVKNKSVVFILADRLNHLESFKKILLPISDLFDAVLVWASGSLKANVWPRLGTKEMLFTADYSV